MSRRISSGSRLRLFLIIAMLSLLMAACGGGGSGYITSKSDGDYMAERQGSASRGGAPGSAAPPMMDMATEEGVAAYDTYADPNMATQEMAMPRDAAAGGEMADGDSPRADEGIEPASGVIDPAKLTEWMVPSAYAQDNMPDVRYLIRNGEASMSVESYSDAEKSLTSIALKYGGMVSDSHSQVYGDNNIEGWIKLRVQNEKFEQAWDEIIAVGEIETKNISTQDVSAEYVASVSRLKNLLDEQATLKLMLDEALAVQRSRGLGEAYSILLDTQRRLSEVTSQIQATEDRIKALADQVTLSTITINLREQPKAGTVVKDEEFSWGFGATLSNGLKDLKVAIKNFLNGLIYFLITCWTWLIPLAFFIWLGRLLYRKFIAPQMRKPANSTAVPPKASV